MAPKSATLLFVIFSLTFTCQVFAEVSVGGPKAAVGGWNPIKDLKAPEVVEVAKFAVDIHNKQSNAFALSFVSVVRGEYQVVNGINYRLTIAANSRGGSGKYQVVVFDKPATKTRKLISFQALHD